MLRKSLTYTVVLTTIIWSVGLFAMPLSVAAVASGDLIKLACSAGVPRETCTPVYYLGADSKRYVFPDEKAFKTWYADFSGVQIVSSTEMSSYAIGGNVTYRPGTKMVKITTDPKVYAVAANGTLRWVTTEAVAVALYGATWASSMVQDVADSYFTNYTLGTDITAAADYDKAAVTTAATSINVDKGLSGGAISTGTGLTVALASDTPASGIVLGNSINNKFTKVNLTASADGDIVIDSLTVRRGGVAASDTPISSIALLDDKEVRIGNTKTLNASHLAIFNQDITVKAGTTKVIYLAANMGATALYAGEVPSLDLYAMTLTGTAAVVGTLPIVGNYQTINGTITIGTLTLADGANNPSASTQKVGTVNYIISGFKLVAGSAEDFKVTQINFKQGGTAADIDIANLRLLVDDVEQTTKISAPVSGNVKFDLSAAPITVAKGKTVQIDLKADIESGSARTIRFDINDESDVVAKGQVYGANVKIGDGGNGATTDAEPFWTAQITTVAEGSLRVGPATLSSANIADDQDGAVLGKFEFEAKGEEIEITALPITFAITTSTGNLGTDSTVDLTNVTLYDENGKIVAGPDDPAAPTAAYSYTICGAEDYLPCGLAATSTDTITVSVGVHIYTVKADLDSDWGANDTIIAHIRPASITAKGSTTGLAITPTPSGEQTSATMTVQGAALSVAQGTTPVAGTVVGGTKGYTFATVNLGANSSGENVKVTKVAFAVHCDGSCNPAEVSNWSLYDGATELSVTNDPDSDTSAKSTDDQEATSTFNLTTALVITKGTSKLLTLKGDINTSAINGAMNVGMSDAATASAHITAKGATTNLDATLTWSVSDGQSMTFTSKGDLTIGRDSTSPAVAALLPASATGLTVGVFNLYSRYEKVNIEKMYLTVPQVNGGGLDQVKSVYIYQGAALVATIAPTSTDGVDATILVDATNNPIIVPKDAATTLTIKVDTAGSDYELGSTGASGQGFSFRLTATGDITAKGDQSGAAITTLTTDASTTEQYLFKSVPIVTVNEDLPASGENAKIANGVLSTSLREPLYRFKVTADSAGPVGLGQVAFQIATTTATSSNWYLYDGSTVVAATTTQTQTTADWATNGCAAEAICYGIIQMLITNDGLIPTGEANVVPLEIAAGTAKYLTLKGDLECSVASCNNAAAPTGGSVQVSLLGDASFPTTLPNSLTALSDDALGSSFIWTDYWRTSIQRNSSTTASSTEQWSNGYLVPRNTIGSTSKLEATSTVVKMSK